MVEWVYKVVDDHGNTIADHMTLENAVILLKGCFLNITMSLLSRTVLKDIVMLQKQ